MNSKLLFLSHIDITVEFYVSVLCWILALKNWHFLKTFWQQIEICPLVIPVLENRGSFANQWLHGVFFFLGSKRYFLGHVLNIVPLVKMSCHRENSWRFSRQQEVGYLRLVWVETVFLVQFSLAVYRNCWLWAKPDLSKVWCNCFDVTSNHPLVRMSCHIEGSW